MKQPLILDRTGQPIVWVPCCDPVTCKIDQTYAPPVRFYREVARNRSPMLTRPYHRQGTFYELTDEIHDWINEQSFVYQIDYRYMDGFEFPLWCVGFRTEENAAIYKLRWYDDGEAICES